MPESWQTATHFSYEQIIASNSLDLSHGKNGTIKETQEQFCAVKTLYTQDLWNKEPVHDWTGENTTPEVFWQDSWLPKSLASMLKYRAWRRSPAYRAKIERYPPVKFLLSDKVPFWDYKIIDEREHEFRFEWLDKGSEEVADSCVELTAAQVLARGSAHNNTELKDLL